MSMANRAAAAIEIDLDDDGAAPTGVAEQVEQEENEKLKVY